MSEPAILIRDLTYSYGPRVVLSDVSLSLAPAQVIALLGPNGSGKSTLLKLLAGLMPLKASVSILGRDLRTQPPAMRARLVAYLSAEIRTEFRLTVHESVALGRICHNPSVSWKPTPLDREKIEAALEACGCQDLLNRELPTLSGGEQQLVAVARALVQDSPVVLLDETLSRMDLHHVARIGELLNRLARSERKTFVLVAHDMNLAAQWSDFAVILDKGRVLAQGALKETLTPENLNHLYPGTPIQVESSASDGRPRVWIQRK
jgi:iron complex transport system ATP-binding protein